ncbi:MAG: dehydrogenase, partial [Acetobacteraceae bacterium]|nr:dehydrogenase [Acetobacteraceae bacterium]
MRGNGMRRFTRRAALLGTAGLLAGCEGIGDTFDSIFGERKRPLPGERKPVLAIERPLGVDEGEGRPISLPSAEPISDWPQAGGTLDHSPGNPALGFPLAEVWRTSVGTGSAYRRRLVAPPIVAADTVYAMDAYGLVTALEAGSGRRRWELDTRPEKERDGALGGGCAFADGVLYVTTGMAEAMA